MSIATLKEVLGKAMRADYGVAAFNVHNLEFMQGVMQAAEEMLSPTILAIAPRSIEHAGLDALAALARIHAEQSRIPVVVHLDHGKDLDTVRRSIALGFSSVMFDGSRLALEENILKTREIVEVARREGVSVEGEIGIMGKFDDLASGSVTSAELRTHFTKPEDAKRFVEETGVDALAVAVGTVHQMPIQEAQIDFQRLRDIQEAVPVPLVFHGCTGLKNEDYQRAYGSGVKKFNIGTRLIKAFQQGLLHAIEKGERSVLACLKAGSGGVYETSKDRIRVLNSAHRA